MQIPSYLVDEAIEIYGRKFLLVYPEREVTEDEYMNGWQGSGKRTGRYYAVCTSCGIQSVWDTPVKYDTDTLRPCPNCGAFARVRKGWYGKKKLADKMYLQAWHIENHDRVILYEAIVVQKDWNNWEEYGGAQELTVYDQRHTILTPGKSETIKWNGQRFRTPNVCSPYEQLGRNTNVWGSPLSDNWNAPRGVYYGIDKLKDTFLSPLYRLLAAREFEPEDIAPAIIRMNEEPIVEFALKAGFDKLADERIKKSCPNHGTIHIDFSARSPKKMFRGLSKNNALQKMKELMKILEPGAVTSESLELAAGRFIRTKDKPEDIAPIVESGNNLRVYRQILSYLHSFPVRRIVDYISSHREHDAYYYRDYLESCRAVGAPLDEARTVFPENLTEAHDAMTRRKKYTFSEDIIKKCSKRHNALIRSGYEYEHDGIRAIVPSKPGEITAEGENLSHCVGTYAQRHCEGETNIIFIRHTDSEESWFTLEVDPKTRRFVQCYGYKNKSCGIHDAQRSGVEYDPEVGKFLYHYSRRLRWAKEHKKELKQWTTSR